MFNQAAQGWIDTFVNSGIYDGSILCVPGNNTDSCPGDSGGPLFRIMYYKQ